MPDKKAYACLEPYENTGAVIFATSNIEARRVSANEFHDGELGGMSVKRAPWADKYESRHNIPISVMVDNGWHFECTYSGLTIDSDLYDYPRSVQDDKGNWIDDDFLVGKEPVGYQDTRCFACAEYEELFNIQENKRKAFEAEQVEFYKNYILEKLPEATIIDEDGYNNGIHVYSVSSNHSDARVIQQLSIPFSFPGMKHWACMKLDMGYYNAPKGPTQPIFTCANDDHEEFLKWIEKQKILRKAL